MVLTIKLGGSTLKEGVAPDFIEDLRETHAREKVVLVHGGGGEVTDIATKLGKEQKFVVSPEGFRSRYTDRETAEIYTMVMSGKINKEIVATLQSHSVPAVGVSGVDGGLIRAKRKKKLIIVDERGRKRIIDGGYTGKITNVNAGILKALLKDGYMPVVAPIALSEEFEYLNIDGDRAAAYVAGAVKAEALILLTDVPGVYIAEKLVSKLTGKEAEAALPMIGPGMSTKIYATMEALQMGVGEVIITSGLGKEPITSALMHRAGTVISNE
jgi:acetylglutamate/LysW-gamma-L-alpha-aminoadipate kinase